jgi:uncharacterized phage-associated protein
MVPIAVVKIFESRSPMSDANPTGPPTSAAAAANYFLSKGREDSGSPPIDQMKLQKLLFYAHAWHLAIVGPPLFADDFEAWPWGPVVRDIYFQTRNYGKAPVTGNITRIKLNKTAGGHTLQGATFEIPTVANKETREFLDEIWDAHKGYTGIQLSNATHEPGEPWTIVSDTYNGNLDHKPTIPNDLIAEVFKEKLSANVPT